MPYQIRAINNTAGPNSVAVDRAVEKTQLTHSASVLIPTPYPYSYLSRLLYIIIRIESKSVLSVGNRALGELGEKIRAQ